MDLSLIICTRDRAAQLRQCLEAVARLQSLRPWELIVIDNGSRDETADVLAQFSALHGGASQGLCVVIGHEPEAGLARARNLGLSLARGDIVAFTDDDCYPEPGYLDSTLEPFDDKQVGFMAGKVLLHDPADYPITILTLADRVDFAPKTFLRTGVLLGANMAFRREALAAAGGFDPAFGVGALFPAEDIDAAARVNLLGWCGLYWPKSIVRHHHGRKLADVPTLMRGYDLGRGAYHMKLLLCGGQVQWFLQANMDLVRRMRRDLGSGLAEMLAEARYLGHWLTRGVGQAASKRGAPLR
jgi:glycosyltransferase involved in cell wall biosynthesis